ncbi:MAG: hypothetical protein L0L39_05220 [Atopostipes suicloacalis]|nr:hypothetical protein [Atopostipes suicloacalis]MDN6731565.1 hypothetical protein [Atopostipes suicloacalis]
MSSWTEEELEKFHQTEFRKRDRLKKSGRLGCFSCGYIFSYHLVEDFFKKEETAICPICGADAVLPLAEFPESEHANLLEEMFLKYLASEETKARLLGDHHYFLFQKRGENLLDAYNGIIDCLDDSNRKNRRDYYKEYENAESISFRVFSGEITIYPLDNKFIKYLLPKFDETENLPETGQKILKKLAKKQIPASFFIDLPGKFSEKEAEHTVKLLGMVFGGHFANIKNLPEDGYLTKEEHIFINAYENETLDIIDNLERLLEKYG